MSTPSSSLLYDLVPPKSETRKGYPATDLIYSLLHNAGADVSSFRRNCQVSYRLIEYARNLYDAINTLVKQAEESGSWEHYDAYNRTIDPLEELLLRIMEVTEMERNEYLITSNIPLNAFRPFLESWADRRAKIRKYMSDLRERSELKGLISSPEGDENELHLAEDYDDRTLLQKLLSSIKENAAGIVRDNTQAIVKNVRESLQSGLDLQKSSPKKLLNKELNTLAIKCAMIAEGVTRLMKGITVEQDSTLYNRLHSNEIWDTAQKLAADIHRFLQDDDAKPNFEDLRQAYEKLEAALIGDVLIDLPPGCNKLFPLIGHIGRSYHAQSQVLASFCYKAISNFQSERNLDTRDALERVVAKTIEAFKAAGALNNKIVVNGTAPAESVMNGTGSSVAGDYNASCEKLYNESIGEIRACYTVMKIEDESSLDAKLEQARIRDKNRLEAYRQRTAGTSHNQELVDIMLKIYENKKDGEFIEEMNARISLKARLTYLKWIVGKRLPGIELEDAYFEGLESGPSGLSLDTEIGNLITNNRCTLYLIVRKNR